MFSTVRIKTAKNRVMAEGNVDNRWTVKTDVWQEVRARMYR